MAAPALSRSAAAGILGTWGIFAATATEAIASPSPTTVGVGLLGLVGVALNAYNVYRQINFDALKQDMQAQEKRHQAELASVKVQVEGLKQQIGFDQQRITQVEAEYKDLLTEHLDLARKIAMEAGRLTFKDASPPPPPPVSGGGS